jgi:hypothetical protein
VLLGVLLRTAIEAAVAGTSRAWFCDNLEHDPELLGTTDLSAILAGLRYFSSIDGIDTEAVPRLKDGTRIKTRGHLDGVPLQPEGRKWRELLIALDHRVAPDLTLVAKDTDGDPATLAGLRQVVEHYARRDPPIVWVIAAPHQDAECWFVAGLDPRPGLEQVAHDAVRKDLKFNPLKEPERLTAHPNAAPTDAKRVLRHALLPPG